MHLEGQDFRPQAHDRTINEIHKGEVRPIFMTDIERRLLAKLTTPEDIA